MKEYSHIVIKHVRFSEFYITYDCGINSSGWWGWRRTYFDIIHACNEKLVVGQMISFGKGYTRIK